MMDQCSQCNKLATHICPMCETMYCDEHAKYVNGECPEHEPPKLEKIKK